MSPTAIANMQISPRSFSIIQISLQIINYPNHILQLIYVQFNAKKP